MKDLRKATVVIRCLEVKTEDSGRRMALVRTIIRDDQTGTVINDQQTNMRINDTITIPIFYEDIKGLFESTSEGESK